MIYGLEVRYAKFVPKNGESSQNTPYSVTGDGIDAIRTQYLNDPGHLQGHKRLNFKGIKEHLANQTE